MTPQAVKKLDVGSSGAVAITGSKGGIGKSNLVLNLAVTLGKWGRKVLLVDGDLGLANIDLLLGLMPRHNVGHLIRDEVSLADALIEGPPGVQILPAASGVPDLANLGREARAKLLARLSEVGQRVDDVLVDTGAGLGDVSLALQMASSRVIVVTTPEPTSMVDAYATLKVLWGLDPTKPVDMVVNAAGDDAEAEQTFEKISRAADRFLNRELGWLGPVYRDPNVPIAVKRQRPVTELFPDSPASACYERIAMRLASANSDNSSAGDYWKRLLNPEPTETELAH
jgi:flagellar biosynthesis protein FlhG